MGSEFRPSKHRNEDGAVRESGTELGNINRLDAAVGVKAGEAVAGVITERIEVL